MKQATSDGKNNTKFMEDIVIGIGIESESLQDKTFDFLITLMGYRNQLRINHWQTTSYAEHELTDKVIDSLTESIDSIGEASLGSFGRPKINTVSCNISDIAITPTDYILKCINENVMAMIGCYKETEYEGILALLGELDANVKKFIYLSTLS